MTQPTAGSDPLSHPVTASARPAVGTGCSQRPALLLLYCPCPSGQVPQSRRQNPLLTPAGLASEGLRNTKCGFGLPASGVAQAARRAVGQEAPGRAPPEDACDPLVQGAPPAAAFKLCLLRRGQLPSFTFFLDSQGSYEMGLPIYEVSPANTLKGDYFEVK